MEKPSDEIVRYTMTLAIAVVGFCIPSVLTAETPGFRRDVWPILGEYCVHCHGPDESVRGADLRLDKEDGLRYAVGDADDWESSELLRRITSDDPDEVMPPPESKHDLESSQIAILRDWIKAGAQWESHWAFVPPTRAAPPEVAAAQQIFVENEIDAFVLQQLGAREWQPNKEADAQRLLRRVTLDLTGVPPTLAELDAFLANSDTAAYSQIVERLLSSPRFGESMAMNWLDAARYADTNGYQGDNERTMWPWRDWVIYAINANMPYDEFSIWQIAGDLIPDATDQQKLATGFCRNHMINGEGGRIPEENRVEYIYDQIETVGTVWMGLTLQCCRCHDHKFDPIAQSEYFQFFAFFNQTPVSGGGGSGQMAPNLTVVPELQRRNIQQQRDALNSARTLLAAAERKYIAQVPDSPMAKRLGRKLGDRSEEDWKTLKEYFVAQDESLVRLMDQFRSKKRAWDAAAKRLPKVMVMEDWDASKRRETFILTKGIYNQQAATVTAGTPSFLPPLQAEPPDRLALATWLFDPSHPLTARVTVNRIWQRFFGTGLVKTAEDFGVQGEKPTHRELLDWLSVEFVESGWDVKHLVRLIVNSAAYRRSAEMTAKQAEMDPENRMFARGPRNRMPAWMIRDHALFACEMAVENLGGPSVKPYQPQGVWADASFGKKTYQPDVDDKLYRRSLYTFWRRIVGPTMFFDMARRQSCSVRTGRTNTPLHALVTLNDTTYVEAARILAERIMRSSPETTKQASLAFRLATSRHPKQQEVVVLVNRLTSLRRHFEQDVDAARDLLAVGQRAVPSELDPAELASLTSVCLTVLNLDEALTK